MPNENITVRLRAARNSGRKRLFGSKPRLSPSAPHRHPACVVAALIKSGADSRSLLVARSTPCIATATYRSVSDPFEAVCEEDFARSSPVRLDIFFLVQNRIWADRNRAPRSSGSRQDGRWSAAAMGDRVHRVRDMTKRERRRNSYRTRLWFSPTCPVNVLFCRKWLVNVPSAVAAVCLRFQ